MTKYTVMSPVKSGGKIHDIGAAIALDDETAAPLLALGRITALGAAKNSSDERSSDDSGDGDRQSPDPDEPGSIVLHRAGDPAPKRAKGGKGGKGSKK